MRTNPFVQSFGALMSAAMLYVSFALFAPVAVAQTANLDVVSFTGDADCGISSDKIYTHAVDFGNAGIVGGISYANPTINGVRFHSHNIDYQTHGNMPDDPQYGWNSKYGWTGSPTRTHGGQTANIVLSNTNQVYKLLYDLFYDTEDGTLQLSGLTPGKVYEFRMYQRQWAVSNRKQILTFFPDAPTPDVLVFDGDASPATAWTMAATKALSVRRL